MIPILLYGGHCGRRGERDRARLADEREVRQHRNNLIPVLAYWPVLLGVLLAVYA